MKKVIFKEINRCDECPYHRYQSDFDSSNGDYDVWYECSFTDNELINENQLEKEEKLGPYGWTIPSWCPLENYDLFHKAIDVVRNDGEV